MASREIQPGDLVEIFLGQERTRFVVRSTNPEEILIYLENDPSKVRRLVPSAQGWLMEGEENQSYRLEFSPGPAQTLLERFTPQLYLSDLYRPIPKLDRFDFDSVRDWFNLPAVRLNLIWEVKLKLALFPFSDQHKQNITLELNSPYLEESQMYITEEVLPNYIREEGFKATIDGHTESDLTKHLIRAAAGALEFKVSDIYAVFTQIFPFLAIEKVPDDGDCYYTSIGIPLGKDSAEVRQDLSLSFLDLPWDEREELVVNTIGNCPRSEGLGKQFRENREEFVQNFSSILSMECKQGGQDCYNCVWGGNFLDELVFATYLLPVVSVGIIPEEEEEEYEVLIDNLSEDESTVDFLRITLDKLSPGFWNSYEEILSFPIMNYVLSVSSTPISEDSFNSTNFLAYIITAGKHTDAILL